MIIRKWALVSLSAVPLLLAGCDSENLDDVQDATIEIDRIKGETVETFNQLVMSEADLQSHFDETMETDDDLATLGDESSSVFENIASREEIVIELENKQSEFEEHQETLTSYDGELLDHEEVNAVNDSVSDFNTHLSSYIDNYKTSLDNQRDYFTGLADENATYDDFVEGIDQINDERVTLLQMFPEIDGALIAINGQLSTLQSSIDAQLSEEE
ncbi:YkyA family protein [Alkalibacterium sp. f15]|uniref:YkyA family protein n=1 Tax=Alkalibacterium sp. f15 TaxID=3414029 RepID=UPI003BF86772